MRDNELKGAKTFSVPSISDRIGYALRIFCAAGSNLDAGARRWFRKLDVRRASTLRKPGAMSYRNYGAAPFALKHPIKTGGESMLIATLVLLSSLFGDSNYALVSTDDPVEYRLLATNTTSTMQKELSEAGAAGYLYSGQTVYNSAFGGREVVVILERSEGAKTAYEYKLLATARTSTMQKELNEAGRAGFVFCGMTVAETAFGGREVVSILRRRAPQE